jgi:UDP-glucuronate decarboxylase
LNALPNFDVIFHAAGYGQPGKFSQDPFSTYNLNTHTTYELLKHIKLNGKFLFFSTSEIYSGLTVGPFKEHMVGTTSPNHSRGSYIEGKRGGEMLVSAAKSELGIDGKSFRLALAYGPGVKADDTRALNQFIKQAIMEKSITLLDQGEAWRTYCYVRDAVELSLIALVYGSEDLYNLGGVSRIQIRDLAFMIGEMTGKSVEFPSSQDGFSHSTAPQEVWLDLTRILSLTSQYHFVPLDLGLMQTIEWSKENLKYS